MKYLVKVLTSVAVVVAMNSAVAIDDWSIGSNGYCWEVSSITFCSDD